MARTYAESGRITIATIKKVAIEHLLSGNKIYCDKAIRELKDAATIEYNSTMHTVSILSQLNAGKHSQENIKNQLVKNNIKYRTR